MVVGDGLLEGSREGARWMFSVLVQILLCLKAARHGRLNCDPCGERILSSSR